MWNTEFSNTKKISLQENTTIIGFVPFKWQKCLSWGNILIIKDQKLCQKSKNCQTQKKKNVLVLQLYWYNLWPEVYIPQDPRSRRRGQTNKDTDTQTLQVIEWIGLGANARREKKSIVGQQISEFAKVAYFFMFICFSYFQYKWCTYFLSKT